MVDIQVIGCPVAIHTKLDPSIREPRLKVCFWLPPSSFLSQVLESQDCQSEEVRLLLQILFNQSINLRSAVYTNRLSFMCIWQPRPDATFKTFCIYCTFQIDILYSIISVVDISPLLTVLGVCCVQCALLTATIACSRLPMIINDGTDLC